MKKNLANASTANHALKIAETVYLNYSLQIAPELIRVLMK